MSEISINVLQNMQLAIHPHIVAADGDHNSATFKITSQPSSLDGLACRAEIQNAAGEKTYRLVDDNGEFLLTNDIAVEGIGYLQLVYGDGVATTRKTNVVPFNVLPSIDAVDAADPDFTDGLAQLQQAAFCQVDVSAGVVRFYNYGGQEVGQIELPGSIEDLDNLYLRVDGGNVMSNNLRLLSAQGIDAPIGIVVGGRQAQLRWEGALILTRGQANEPVQIENNNGSNRSDIVTVLSGDARYLTPGIADQIFVHKAGDQMSGPLITASGSGLTNPGIGIGDNSTGFYRSGSSLLLSVGGLLYAQWLGSPASLMMTVPLNMATLQVTNVGNPDAAASGNSHAMPRSYADGRYLQLTGGIVTGPVLLMSAPVVPNDAANKSYVDGAVAAARPNNRTYLTNTVELLNTAAQILLDQSYPVADNNLRTIVVTVFPSFSGGTPSAFYDLIYTCSVAPLIEARSTVYPTAGAYMQSPVRFAATLTPTDNAIQVQIAVRLNAAATGPLTIVGSSETRRSYVTIEEQAN